MSSETSTLHRLRWQRLKVVLGCRRVNPSMRAHALAIIQAIVKGVSVAVNERPWPADGEPGVFFHMTGRRHTVPLLAGDQIGVEVLFCNRPDGYAEGWLSALQKYLEDPETGKNFSIVELHPVESRSLADLEEERPDLPNEGEICLDFLTPFPFTPDNGKNRTFFSRHKLIQLLQSRVSRLFGISLNYQADTDDFDLLPYYWNYTEIRHPSRSQPGKVQFINGCTGRLYLKGSFAGLLPWLRLASELHIGRKLSNS